MTTRVTDPPPSPPSSDSAAADGLSDEALLRKLVAGDAGAAHVLVGRYHRPLTRYLRRLSGQDALADELHQQTWLSVLEHAARFDAGADGRSAGGKGGGFKAWLFRIATNKANDLWRKRRRESVGDERASGAVAPDVPDRMEAAEDARRLAEAIARLPEPQRQVLLLRYYGGLKFTEIAEAVGCPLNTALGRMHKAVGRLKVLLGDAADDSRPGARVPARPAGGPRA